MHESPRTRLIAYGVAVLGTAGCLLARWPLWPVLGNRHPYLTCFPAVFISAYYGGFRPGLLAALLGAWVRSISSSNRFTHWRSKKLSTSV